MEIAAESFESLQLGAQRRIQKGAKGARVPVRF